MRLSIKLLLIFINLLLYWGSANAQTQWNSAFTPIPGTGDDVIISENIVEIPYGQVVEIASLGITGKKNDIGKLIVNGTLIIHGDLTMIDNFTAFEMGSSAIVIVDGNFAAENKITIQLDSYLIVRGDFTKSGAEGQGSLEVVADIDSPAHIYIFGETSGWDSSFTTCDDYASTDGNLSSADCDYGTLPNFIENLDDLPGFVTELLGCDNTSTPSFWGSISSNSPIGDGGNIQLTGTGANVNWQHTIKHYTWTGPNNYFFQATEYTDMNVVISNASELNEGYYYYSCYSEVGCYTKDSVYVEIGCVPENSPTWNGISGKPHSNGTRRTGETISLFANAQSSPSWAYKPVAYFWTGPNDFSASTQNPTLNNVNTSMSGYYTCTATNTAGCSITDSTYVLVSDCGFSSGYYSRDNYAGNWSDKSSWGVSDNSLQTPPPYDPNSSQTITINGYITLNGSLRLSGSQQYICDTLVVDGIFFADNPTLTIGPNGVLIVLDDYIGTSGSIKNEGQVVFAGEVQNPDSWSVISNAGGTTYILDPDPVGQMPEYSDLDDLKNDQDLYNFYISLVGGAPIITTCPPDAEFACIEDLPIVQNITDFEGIGGEVSDNNDASNLTISYKDVTATASGCRVIRTYTITDKAGNLATCQQEFTIRDDIDPVITCVDLSYVPANDDCSVTISVDKPVINVDTDNCGYGDIEPVYSYHLANDPENEMTGMGDIPETNFPLGRTTIHWTFADECGNSVSCTQIIDVNFELSEISYDNGSTSTDAGSGVYPMQTSTHTYAVDSKVPEEGYSYEWKLFERNGESLGDVVDPADYVIDQSGAYNSASVAIRFSDTLPKESEYFIAVEKLRNETQCAKQKVLPIKIYQNDFDVILLPTGSDCQAGETGTPSTILWEISFPEIVTEPFQFDYNITLDGNPICTGTVYGISYSETSLNHNSGCPAENPAVPPYTLVSKNQNSNTVRLEYVVSSITNADLQIGLTIEATDVFEVSDSDISNDSEDVTLWGVPNTSDIQTD